jgi:Leucine-rich repeat (LRR) protein
MWEEYNYDTRLLHSNLAFPLLKRLAEVGDPNAKRLLREEIAKRLGSGFSPVIKFLINENYLEYLNHEESVSAMLELKEVEVLLTIEMDIGKAIEILAESHEGKVGIFAIVKDRHVESLSLQKCDLKEIPKMFKNFEKLKTLNLTCNNLSRVPKWILKFTNLQKIYIGGNQIKLLPEWIGKFKSLKWLDISYNPIELLPESIKELENIEYLNVECCPLKQFPDLSSDHLPQGLKDLNYYLNDVYKKEVK